MKANSDKSKQSNKATRRVLAGVLCGASVLSLVLSLVMPPISQAIANDAEAGAAEKTVAAADSSTESTDVDNTTGGDAENQKSDETESDEADPSNGVEQGQPEGKLQAEDGELSDGNAVMLAADGGQTKTAPIEIQTADELKKLANASGVASFKLMNDVETSETITLNNGSNITLNLNGHKIKYGSVRPGLTFRPVIFLRLHNGRPLSNLNPARGDAPETGRVARLALPFHADLPANSPSPRRAPAS